MLEGVCAFQSVQVAKYVVAVILCCECPAAWHPVQTCKCGKLITLQRISCCFLEMSLWEKCCFQAKYCWANWNCGICTNHGHAFVFSVYYYAIWKCCCRICRIQWFAKSHTIIDYRIIIPAVETVEGKIHYRKISRKLKAVFAVPDCKLRFSKLIDCYRKMQSCIHSRNWIIHHCWCKKWNPPGIGCKRVPA